MVSNFGLCDVVLKAGNVDREGWFKGSIGFTGHAFVTQPGDGISNDIVMLKGLLELCYKAVEGAHGNSCSGNGFLPERSSPS